MSLSCLDTLVGLSSRDCDCFDDGNFFYQVVPTPEGTWERQAFDNQESATITWASGASSLPTTNTASRVWLYQRGQKLSQGSQYSISGNNIAIASGTHFSGADYEVLALVSSQVQLSTSGVNQSDSGYYLTDREYGFPLKEALDASKDCGEDGIWNMLYEARSQAIRDFKVDLQQALNEVRDSKVINWRGTVAKAESTGYNNTVAGNAGIQVRPKYRLKDAFFVIKAVWVGLDTTKSFSLNITSNDGSFASGTRTVNATAGQWQRNELSTTISLPLYSIARTDVKYNIHYSLDGAKPYNNRMYCCNPPGWMKHIAANGIMDSNFADDTLYASNYGSGLALEGYFTCNKLDWICDLKEMNGLDFRDLLARCIQFKGAVKLMSMVLESGKVNYYTLLDTKGLLRRRSKLQKMYSEYLLWAAQNLPANVTSCWGCEKHAPRVDSILV